MSATKFDSLRVTLSRLKDEGKVRIALLFGSHARGDIHARSDVDLAVYLTCADEREEIATIDRILMATDCHVDLLRLDDEDESPFIVQKALKGEHLVPPDEELLSAVVHWALRESESIRFRREAVVG